jgi:hypothetical protein
MNVHFYNAQHIKIQCKTPSSWQMMGKLPTHKLMATGSGSQSLEEFPARLKYFIDNEVEYMKKI